jgi:hypothetical protein
MEEGCHAMSAEPSALAKRICQRFYGDGPAVPLWQIIDEETADLQRDNASMRAEIYGEEELREVRESISEAERLDWWIRNAEGIAKDRGELRDLLRDLSHRVHSGYDFNADPDGITLRVGDALARPASHVSSGPE